MSVQGMWTRQFTPEGVPFYFNATLNKSLWKAPPNSVVLESDRLKEKVEKEKTQANTLNVSEDKPSEIETSTASSRDELIQNDV